VQTFDGASFTTLQKKLSTKSKNKSCRAIGDFVLRRACLS
jgi:hypothetical protein